MGVGGQEVWPELQRRDQTEACLLKGIFFFFGLGYRAVIYESFLCCVWSCYQMTWGQSALQGQPNSLQFADSQVSP